MLNFSTAEHPIRPFH